MKPSTKKILIGSALVLATGLVIAGVKAKNIKDIFDLMEIEPETATSIKLDWNVLKFNLDVRLTNKSDDDLFVSGAGIASLRSIKVFYKGVYLATAEVSMNEIEVGGQESLIIKNIPVQVDWATGLKIIKALVDFDIQNIGIIGVIEALGQTYEIGGE